MTDKLCGNVGCRRDAVGTITQNGYLVYTCEECANQPIETKL